MFNFNIQSPDEICIIVKVSSTIFIVLNSKQKNKSLLNFYPMLPAFSSK